MSPGIVNQTALRLKKNYQLVAKTCRFEKQGFVYINEKSLQLAFHAQKDHRREKTC